MPELEIIELYHQEIVLEFQGELGIVIALVQALPAASSGGGGGGGGNLGTAFKGAYSSSTSYSSGDVVTLASA